jgi:hypothetical protein
MISILESGVLWGTFYELIILGFVLESEMISILESGVLWDTFYEVPIKLWVLCWSLKRFPFWNLGFGECK